MKCIYLHKLCGDKPDCTNMVCRSHFPERQPIVKEDMLELCLSAEHVECQRFVEGEQTRLERKRNQWKLHCPFASNARCGRPWEWTCKGSDMPFLLTTYEVNEKGLPLRGEDGGIVFTRTVEDIKETCLSGDPEIYEKCPHYISGVQYREDYYKLRPHLQSVKVKEEGKE